MKRILSYLLLNLIFSAQINGQTNLVKGDILKKNLIIEDLTILEKALTEIHPGIYRYNTPETIKQAFEVYKNNLPIQLSEAEFIKGLAQLVSKIRCGHTYVNPWNMNAELRERLFGGKIFFPIGFEIVDNRFIATENASNFETLKRGAEILSINGYPTSQVHDSLQTIARSDGNNYAPFRNYLSLNNYEEYLWEAFDIYFPLFFPLQESEFAVEFKNYGSEESQKIKVSALSKAERAQKMAKKYGSEILESKRWKFDIVNEDLAIIKLGTFAIWNWEDFNYKNWYRDAFREINSRGIKNLIIDIRGNGGGMGEPRDELMGYLTDKKLNCEEDGKILIRTTKVDESLHAYCDTYAKPILTGLPKSKYSAFDENWYELKEKSDCVTIKPNKDRFTGHVYVFGNGSNVSATYQQLDKLKRNGLATLIGDVSGGNLQGVNGGQYIFLRLPHSKMEVDIPLKYFSPKGTQPDKGVDPDEIIYYTQKDIAEKKDAYLEFVLSKLK